MSSAKIRAAPLAAAPRTAARPTPPNPTTATVWPGRTWQVFITVPTPVITAQPNSAASVRGMSRRIFTIDRREITEYSEKAQTPQWWFNTVPSSQVKRRAPESSMPAPFAAEPAGQSAGRPSWQKSHSPQTGWNDITT